MLPVPFRLAWRNVMSHLLFFDKKWSLNINFKRLKAAFSAVAADCMDGDNGGCSHYCAMVGGAVECSCPTCWELDADNNCAPAQSALHVGCSATEMHVEIDKCVYQDDVDLVWGGINTCAMATLFTAADGSDWYEITTNLDDCATAASSADGLISFTNSGPSLF